jgi:hypothetical protein
MSKIVQIWRRVINKIAKPNIQEIWKNVIWRGHLWAFVIYLETKTPFSSMFSVHKKRGTIIYFLWEVCHKVSFEILPTYKMSMKHFPKRRNLNPCFQFRS